MTKTRLATALVSLLLPFLVSPSLPGREGNGRDNPKDDPCAQLAHVRGLALGIEKKCLAGGGSSGIAKADFNADGFADLAVGVPGEETRAGQPAAGAVNVIYGSANGLTTTDASVPPPQFLCAVSRTLQRRLSWRGVPRTTGARA